MLTQLLISILCLLICECSEKIQRRTKVTLVYNEIRVELTSTSSNSVHKFYQLTPDQDKGRVSCFDEYL